MTDDLETLRPEIREAVAAIDKGNGVFVNGDDSEGGIAWATARAELLRLTDENARLLAANRDAMDHFEQMKAELAAAQNTIAAQQGTMGALKRKLALAEGELAALKARIAEAPEWYDHPDCVGISASGVMVGLHGKRVRLVVEE